MFGDKAKKKENLTAIPKIIKTHQPVRRSLIARLLNVQRSTVTKYITTLESQGIKLVEDQKGRLSLFDEE